MKLVNRLLRFGVAAAVVGAIASQLPLQGFSALADNPCTRGGCDGFRLVVGNSCSAGSSTSFAFTAQGAPGRTRFTVCTSGGSAASTFTVTGPFTIVNPTGADFVTVQCNSTGSGVLTATRGSDPTCQATINLSCP